MKPTLLAGAFGFLIVGAASAALMAQAKQPLQQPNSEAAATVPAGELALGTMLTTSRPLTSLPCTNST